MGITDYLSRSPNDSEKGDEDNGMLTIMLINDLNNMKNRQINERVLSKLLKHRKNLIKDRNKTSETKITENKKRKYKLDRKAPDKTNEHRNDETVQRMCEHFGEDQRPKALFAYDKIINKCFSQLVTNHSRASSFTTEMQAEDSLSNHF